MNYKRLVEKILKENYTDFLDTFYDKFVTEINQLKEVTIDEGDRYYRARIGNDTLEAAIDDKDILCDIPYFESGIEAPPARFAHGGRFNREGISYLYLADNIETCIAEIHLQVGQICSVAQFECVKKGKYVLIEKSDQDDAMGKLYSVLTKPVHNEIRDYYLVTQFFSDIFKKRGCDGIIFSSSQGQGKNVVSFRKEYFKLVKYSEKLYKAKKISYEVESLEEEYKKFEDYRKLLQPGNIFEDEKRVDKYRYVQEKIEHEDEKKFDEAKEQFDVTGDVNAFIENMHPTCNFQKTCEYIGAFYLNKGELEEGVRYFKKGLSFRGIPCIEDLLKRIKNCEWVEQEKKEDESDVWKKIRENAHHLCQVN